MYALVGDIKGKNVLCLGCGTGEECNYLKKAGAKKVIGIDVSAAMINRAKQQYPNIEFQTLSMEAIQSLNAGAFDLVYSSLAFHYIKDWGKLLTLIHHILKKEGHVLFSSLHPFKTACRTQRSPRQSSFILGHIHRKSGNCETFGDYLNIHPVHDTWFNNQKTTYYHRPFAKMITDIQSAGFSIKDIREPKAIKSAKRVKPDFFNTREKIPLVIIFSLKK